MFGEQQRFVLLLITPAALLMLLFQVVPIVIGANASFRDWALYNPKKTWVGFDHYAAVLSDPAFLYVVLLRWCQAWRRGRGKKPDAPACILVRFRPTACDGDHRWVARLA